MKNKIINNHVSAGPDTLYAGAAGIFGMSHIGSLVIRGNEINNNSATVTGGVNSLAIAAVFVSAKESILFEHNQVHGNVSNAVNSGAIGAGMLIDGLYPHVGNYIVRNNTIRNNTFNTENSGGGGVLIQNCSPLVYNNIIAGNSAWSGAGVWIFHWKFADDVAAPQPLFINNTIVNNSATGPGGGILVAGSESYAYLMNNIVWDNGGSTNAQLATSNGAVVNVRYSIVQGNYSGEGNFDIDPMLVADSLADESPAIGRGTHEYDFGEGVVLSCPLHGINGRERPFPHGSSPDIGAWESNLKFPTGMDAPTGAEIPEHFTLQQNYPNPFNPTTTIHYTIPANAQKESVQLKVYDMLGRNVATLVNEHQHQGEYKVEFDAGGLASGIYFYRLAAGRFESTKKMVLMR